MRFGCLPFELTRNQRQSLMQFRPSCKLKALLLFSYSMLSVIELTSMSLFVHQSSNKLLDLINGRWCAVVEVFSAEYVNKLLRFVPSQVLEGQMLTTLYEHLPAKLLQGMPEYLEAVHCQESLYFLLVVTCANRVLSIKPRRIDE